MSFPFAKTSLPFASVSGIPAEYPGSVTRIQVPAGGGGGGGWRKEEGDEEEDDGPRGGSSGLASIPSLPQRGQRRQIGKPRIVSHVPVIQSNDLRTCHANED